MRGLLLTLLGATSSAIARRRGEKYSAIAPTKNEVTREFDWGFLVCTQPDLSVGESHQQSSNTTGVAIEECHTWVMGCTVSRCATSSAIAPTKNEVIFPINWGFLVYTKHSLHPGERTTIRDSGSCIMLTLLTQKNASQLVGLPCTNG